MNRKKGIIIGTTGIIIVTLALIGFTYGYYMSQIFGNENSKSVILQAGHSKLEYIELTTDETEEVIGVGYTNTKFFAVQNIGEVSSSYYMYLVNVTNDFVRQEDIVYSIYRIAGDTSIEPENFDKESYYNSSSNTYNLEDWTKITSSTCPTVSKYTSYGDCQYPASKSLLKTTKETITNPNDYYVYALVVTYINQESIDQSADDGHIFGGQVRIYADESGTDVSPFEKGTLADAIYLNALNETNGTVLRSTPLTEPVKEISSFKYVKTADPTTFTSSRSSATNYYIAYASDYSIDPNTGKLTLGTDENPVTIMDSKYVYSSDLANTLSGKYAYWSTSKPTTSTLNTLSSLYKITTTASDITSSTIKYASIQEGYESTEKVLSITTDDHGTTYYYRGGVQDNYLLFNNMCFRIVRINGDGSIKITLAGDVSEGATTCNEVTDTSAFLKDGTSTKYVAYGYKSVSGLRILADYENYSGGLEDALETWYNEKFNTETLKNKLQNETWCLGGNINYKYNETNGDLMTDPDVLNQYTQRENEEGYGYNSWYYSAGKRLWTTKTTDLTCGSDEDKVTSKYGTLTSDEVALAGGNGSSNYTYYLYDNAKNDYYWTLSRAIFGSGDDYAFIVDINGDLNGNFVGDSDCGVRPSVSLATNTQITGGDGTIGNPYIVDMNA